jgi:hypothetical protein
VSADGSVVESVWASSTPPPCPAEHACTRLTKNAITIVVVVLFLTWRICPDLSRVETGAIPPGNLPPSAPSRPSGGRLADPPLASTESHCHELKQLQNIDDLS